VLVLVGSLAAVATSSRLVSRPNSFIIKSSSPDLDVPTRPVEYEQYLWKYGATAPAITSLIIPHVRPAATTVSAFKRAGGERRPTRDTCTDSTIITPSVPKCKLSRIQMFYVWDYIIRKQSALDFFVTK
jgi:hypothetical protein